MDCSKYSCPEKSNPLFSIVIPLFNKESTIRMTVDSCLTQTFSDFEVVIVDDGSTDRSLSIVENINDCRIRIIEQSNAGVSSARNRGVKHSRGKWVVFLDADDILLPIALEEFRELQSNYPSVDVLCCNHYIETHNVQKLYSTKYKNGKVKYNFWAWLTKRLMPRAGALALKKAVAAETPFNEKLRRYEDVDVWFKLLRKETFATSKKPVMSYQRDYSSASKPRNSIDEDYIGNIKMGGGCILEDVAKYEILKKSKTDYGVKYRTSYMLGFLLLFTKFIKRFF